MINKVSEKILAFYEDQGVGVTILQSFIFAVAFIALFPPRMLLTVDVYIKVDLYLKLIVVAYIYLISFCYIVRYKKMPFLVIAVSLYCIAVFVSTVVNHGDIKVAIWADGILAIAMVLLIFNVMERNYDWGLKLLYIVYYVAILINLFFVFQTIGIGISDSMDRTFLFGNYNRFIKWFLPAQAIGYIISRKSEKKIVKVSFFLLCLLNVGVIFYVESATSIVVILIFDLYMLLFNNEVTKKILSIYTYLIGNILFFICIVVLRVQNDFISNIVRYLGKNMTFSSRTPIWDNALYFIRQNPILGVGMESVENIKSKLGFSAVHNTFLEILYTGGAIGFTFFAIIVTVIVIKIIRCRNVDYKIIGCLSMFLGCYFLSAQFESHTIMVSVINFSIVYFLLNAYSKEVPRK